MKNLKLITIAISLILLTGCGFKVIDKRELLNFNIKEISTNGDKRINFELKNKLSDYNDTNSSKVIKIELDTKKTKSIKEKNISNEITKYQIKVIVNVKLIKTDNTNNLEFTIEREGDYVVADKFSQTLNNEKKLIRNITEKISESIIGEIINKLNVI
jgi:outer membrane lipopolysaccharide assembly protein LptE/RlpB|tara:strand:- start:241 stop:714 length:474 start_codon:yes stop_codon:yes gene_type:complete